MTNATRVGFTLIELLVVITIIGLLVGLLLPAIQAAREAARRSHCANNLRQLAIATENYHAANRKYPSGGQLHDHVGQNGIGWRVLVLPYLEHAALFNLIDPTPNGGANNWNRPQGQMPHIFHCPSENQVDSDLMVSHYWGVGGVLREGEVIGQTDEFCGLVATNGIYFAGSHTRVAEVCDGTSNTLALGERVYIFRPWMNGARWSGLPTRKVICSEAANNVVYPINAAREQFGYYVGDPDRTTSESMPLNDLPFGSLHPGGAYFAFADSSVHYLSQDIDFTVYQELATKDGGEVHQWKP